MPATPHADIEDLTRLRAIAEEGRNAPLLGGRHILLWAAAVIVALLVNWAVATRILAWPGWSLAAIWFGIALAAWAASFAIGRRQCESSGAFAVGNRVEAAVWTVAGLFLMVLATGLFAHGLLARDPAAWGLFAIMPPVAFGAYAVAFGGTAAAAGRTAMQPNVLLSLAFVAVTTMLVGAPEQSLAAAAGVAIVSLPTGFRQLAAERRAG